MNLNWNYNLEKRKEELRKVEKYEEYLDKIKDWDLRRINNSNINISVPNYELKEKISQKENEITEDLDKIDEEKIESQYKEQIKNKIDKEIGKYEKLIRQYAYYLLEINNKTDEEKKKEIESLMDRLDEMINKKDKKFS
jgi:hypothetical protein